MSGLEAIKREIRDCTKCPLAETRNLAVPGEGNSSARIALVAQAPGEVEDEEGNMFVGRSGSILNSLIERAGVERKSFYMTNLVKCFLPDYRRPKREEIEQCTGYLDEEIRLVEPEIIVPLGYYPARYLLKKYGFSVPEEKSKIFNRLWYGNGQKIYPLGHPAAIVYDDSLEDELREDYKKLKVLSRNCKWQSACPMRRFYQQGELESKWIEKYCRGDWESCRRYQMEERGEPHPDWMLPDGTISQRLKEIARNNSGF
ncbi:uracil-DNA glycosylase [Candidatus Bipolaricaulota bacterium]|nr:uracil-DNA glycosylase [Candidatus Bipolaricaulota bacterium]